MKTLNELNGLVLSENTIEAYYKLQTNKAKTVQARSYTSKRKGYCKPLPMGALTPKANETRWALLAQGTDASAKRNLCNIDARHKPVLGDRRIMRETANINPEDSLYTVPKGLNIVEYFIEFLKIRKLRADRESATALEGRLNAQEYRLLKRALSRGELERVSSILERALNNNIK